MNKKYISRLTAIMLCALTGCMSMDEMLASHDSAIHGRGEDRAVEALTDNRSESTLQEKLSLLEKVSDQKRLAKIYVGEHTAPEVKAAAVKRITDEDACLIIVSESKDEETVKAVLPRIKSDVGRIDAVYALLLYPTESRKKAADAIIAGFSDHDKLDDLLVNNMDKYIWDCPGWFQKQRWKKQRRNSGDYDEDLLQKPFVLMLGYYRNDRQLRRAYLLASCYCNARNGRGQLKADFDAAYSHRDEHLRRKAEREREEMQRKCEEEEVRERAAKERIKERINREKKEEFARCLKDIKPDEECVAMLKKEAAAFKGQTLVIKGFYVGMPFRAAVKLVWASSKNVKCKSEWEATDNVTNEVMKALGGIMWKNKSGTLTLKGGGIDADEKGNVTRIAISRNRADTLFGIEGVKGKLFCQQLVDAYDNIEELEYSSVEVEDKEAKERYLNRSLMNAMMYGSNMMAAGFSAGANMPDFKKYIACYHCESKQGWALKVFADATGEEPFLILEKTQKVELKNFD